MTLSPPHDGSDIISKKLNYIFIVTRPKISKISSINPRLSKLLGKWSLGLAPQPGTWCRRGGTVGEVRMPIQGEMGLALEISGTASAGRGWRIGGKEKSLPEF